MALIKNRKLKEAIRGYSFISINLIGVLIFWAIPLLFSIVISFAKWDFMSGFSGIKFIGFKNYVDILNDEWFRVSFINNIIFTIGYVVLLLVISFFVALGLKQKFFGNKLVKMGMYLPYIVNVVAISAVWMALFSKFGPIVGGLKWLGVENPPVMIADVNWALPAVIIVSVWGGIGYVALLFLSGLVSIPEDLYESAQIDGANAWKQIIKITIPMLAPTTFFITVTSIINSFKVFGLINVMTNGGPGNSTTMLVFNIYRTGFRFGKMGFASAQGVVLMIMVLTITLIQFYQQKKFDV